MGDVNTSFLQRRAKKFGAFLSNQSGPLFGGFLTTVSLAPTPSYQFVLSVPSIKNLAVALYSDEIAAITDLGVETNDEILGDQQVYLQINTLKRVDRSMLYVYPNVPLIKCVAYVTPSDPSNPSDDAFLVAGWSLETGLVLLSH